MDAEAEIPQRVKIVRGQFLPEFPDECEPHTPDAPTGYIGYFEWCESMSEHYDQRQCKGCGLWAIWEPKPATQARVASRLAYLTTCINTVPNVTVVALGKPGAIRMSGGHRAERPVARI